MLLKATKFIGLIIVLFLTLHNVHGQTNNHAIQYLGSDELLLNQIAIDSETTVEDLVEILGEPSKKTDYPSGEISYFYDEIGLVFFTLDDRVRGIGINFNWDGDTKFPEQSYIGTLEFGKTRITQNTTNDDVAAIQEIEFICPVSLICASKERDAVVRCTVAFVDNKISQAAFLLE